MNVLGAETGQLEALATQLGATSAEIGMVKASTNSTATEVVAEMQDAFGRAVGRIEASMEQLHASVVAANGRLHETTWTGANAQAFQSGYTDFEGAMQSFGAAVRAGYAEFNAQMVHMGSMIGDLQAQIDASMSDAEASTVDMQQAVSSQQVNLETAMNTGLSFS